MAKTIVELRDELALRERELLQLQARRESLAAELAEVDRGIESLLGAPRRGRVGRPPKVAAMPAERGMRRRRGRPRSEHSLPEMLASVLEGKGPVKVADALKMVLKAGYKTRSDRFGNIVSQTLAGNSRFRKISRGVYELADGR